MAMSQTWMEGFQTRARAALEAALSRLDPQWVILAELRIDGPGDDVAADYVAIHPAHGVALVDVGAAKAGDQIERLRALLDGQKFATIFPGNLPIVHLAVRPADAALIGRRLDAAFAKAPQLTLRNADWAAAVQDLLVPIDATAPEPAAAPASVAKPPPTTAQPPERRPPAPDAKQRPAASKPHTEAASTAAQAAWSVAPGAKPAPEAPRVDRRDASPPVGSVTEPVAPKQRPAPEQPQVNRGQVDRGNDSPPAAPIPSPLSPDKKPGVAATPAAAIPAAERRPVASDTPTTRAPKDVQRGFDASRAEAIAEPAKNPAPLPSSFEPGADAPRLKRTIAGDGRHVPQPLRLDRAGDIPRARAVTGGELIARRDDAIVGPPPSAPAPQRQQWAAVAAIVTLIIGGASWWVFNGPERPATPGAGRAVADISPSRTLEKPPSADNAVPSPAAPSVVPPAPQTGTVAALSPPSGSADADTPTAPPVATSQTPPPLAPSAPLPAAPANSIADKPATATPPVKMPAPPAPSAAPPAAATSSTAPPATPRPRPAPSKPALVSAKSPIATPPPERAATLPMNEARSASLRGSNPPSPPSPPASARSDAPPFGAADLPPLDSAAAPSPGGTAVAAAAPTGLHGPTSLLPSTSVATATPPAPPIEVCRAYTSMKTLLGQPRPVSGVTCRGQDGQWHIITELPN
jgi:hypothetical protein